jgi:hypothetical protein
MGKSRMQEHVREQLPDSETRAKWPKRKKVLYPDFHRYPTVCKAAADEPSKEKYPTVHNQEILYDWWEKTEPAKKTRTIIIAEIAISHSYLSSLYVTSVSHK